MASYKYPRLVELRRSLPQLANGKIDKKVLKAETQTGAERIRAAWRPKPLGCLFDGRLADRDEPGLGSGELLCGLMQLLPRRCSTSRTRRVVSSTVSGFNIYG